MEIKKAGSQPSKHGTSDWFTGTVRIDDDLDLSAVLDDATAAAEPAAPAEPAADEEIVLDDLSIDGLEVDET